MSRLFDVRRQVEQRLEQDLDVRYALLEGFDLTSATSLLQVLPQHTKLVSEEGRVNTTLDSHLQVTHNQGI